MDQGGNQTGAVGGGKAQADGDLPNFRGEILWALGAVDTNAHDGIVHHSGTADRELG